MRGTTLTAGLLALSALVAHPAAAQDTTATTPGAERAAGDLLTVMHLDQQWPTMMNNTVDRMITNQPVMAPFRETMLAFMTKYAGWQAAAPSLQHLYAQQFTEAELRDMITFYRSPTGQKSVAKMAELQEEAAKMGEDLVAAHKAELTAAIMLRAQQIKDSSFSTPGPVGGTVFSTGAPPSP